MRLQSSPPQPPPTPLSVTPRAASTPGGRSHCTTCAARGDCLIGQLPPAQRVQIQPWIHERSRRKNDVLLQQGDPVHVLSLVKVGAILLTRKGADGRPRPLGIFGSGSAIGTCSLPGQRSVVGAQALTSLRLCEVDLSQLHQAEQRGLVAALQRTQAGLRAFEVLADWSQVARVQGITGQVAAALLLLSQGQRSHLVRLPSHHVLGALLGTTRESVARALARLELQGHLRRRDRWHCEIVEDSLRTCIADTPVAAV